MRARRSAMVGAGSAVGRAASIVAVWSAVGLVMRRSSLWAVSCIWRCMVRPQGRAKLIGGNATDQRPCSRASFTMYSLNSGSRAPSGRRAVKTTVMPSGPVAVRSPTVPGGVDRSLDRTRGMGSGTLRQPVELLRLRVDAERGGPEGGGRRGGLVGSAGPDQHVLVAPPAQMDQGRGAVRSGHGDETDEVEGLGEPPDGGLEIGDDVGHECRHGIDVTGDDGVDGLHGQHRRS